MLSARPVSGRFRRLRTAADALLIAILLALPWIRIDGEPLLLLDVPARQFHVFGLVIFPQELYFLWLLLAALALALFFFTALLGRLWCGWACPQTVFTDLYAALARRVQGWRGTTPPRRIARWRRVATHALWLLLSAVVAFHLVGYFRSPYETLAGLRAGQLYPTSFAFFGAVTALTYFDFGLLRQGFCKYICPYARFQSVLFDRDTLVVAYDERRGEPRGKRGVARGDCVDCGLEGRRARLLRLRTAVYATLLALVVGSFGAALLGRAPMDFQVAHTGGALVSQVADGREGNAFTLRITNRSRAAHRFQLTLDAAPGLELLAGLNPIPVAATSSLETRVFVLADPGQPSREIHFVLEQDGGAARVVRSAHFVAGSGG